MSEREVEDVIVELLAPRSKAEKRQRLLDMISDNIRYREALRFYAEGKHFTLPSATNDNRPTLWDEGQTAQRALDGEAI